jgi:hypothetical protein
MRLHLRCGREGEVRVVHADVLNPIYDNNSAR